MFSDAMRLELEAFNITVVNLKTGGVRTNVTANVRGHVESGGPKLPGNSLYAPAREEMERALRVDWIGDSGTPAKQWAEQVGGELLRRSPPQTIWAGESAAYARYGSLLPLAWFDGMVKRMTGLDKVQAILESK